jgi:hypothetical protein
MNEWFWLAVSAFRYRTKQLAPAANGREIIIGSKIFFGSPNALQVQGISVSCFKIDATNMMIQNRATPEIR